jgi:hypothetical protein
MDAPTFVTYYLQHVEGIAEQLTVINTPLLANSWYSELIEDEELRRAVIDLWGQVAAEYDLSQPGTADYWNGAARFSHLLAKHYQGRRTVYALHGPVSPFPDPPYFVGLGDGFYRLDFALPDMVRMVEPEEPIAKLPQGVNLISFEIAPATAESGDLVEFRARWQLEEPLPGMLFAIRLLPAQEGWRSRWQQLLAKSCFQQGYPVLYGLWYLSATPTGTVYEQQGKYIIPSNCPSGDYRFEIGYAQSLPPTYGHWVELDARHGVRVRARPFPTNGP